MFQILADEFQRLSQPRERVFLVHPIQLGRWLEEAWAAGAALPPIPGQTNPFLGSDSIITDVDLPIQPLRAPSGVDPNNPNAWGDRRFEPPVVVDDPDETLNLLMWHHLMYAYLVESTGVVEIFAQLIGRLIQGEGLGQLRAPSIRWLRATEELFFRDPPSFTIASVVSELRPHSRVNRRQAYWRMFGFDLPHRMPPGVPGSTQGDEWKQAPGLTANTDFRAKWTELLRQVWLGLENRANAVGANPTDASYVALLCQALENMMNDRRRGGLMAREEFAYVAMMSWFELTLESNTSIVEDLKAQGSFADERLRAIASRVGMQPAARTRELFQLAQIISRVVRSIELGLFSAPGGAAGLFTGNTQLTRDMNEIVNLWQSATGDRVKERPVGTPSNGAAQPLRAPQPMPVAVGNGASP